MNEFSQQILNPLKDLFFLLGGLGGNMHSSVVFFILDIFYGIQIFPSLFGVPPTESNDGKYIEALSL